MANELTREEKKIDERLRAASLHFKFDNQLKVMLPSHIAKLKLVGKDLRDITDYPDWKRKELRDGFEEMGFEGRELLDAIERELAEQVAFYQTKGARLTDAVFLVGKEIEFRRDGKVERKPKGTTYYIDFTNGDDVLNDGSTPVKSNGDGPWATLDQFTENVRAAGDKAIVRRGMTQIVTTDLDFTSDGTVDNPIIIEADFDDAWGDFVDLSLTATATLAFGSKTVTFSADISGVLSANDWIYVYGEDNREFSYEVADVSVAVVTLYLPYKGDQAGAGKTVINMGSAPIWNTAAGVFEVNIDSDNFWKIQGLHLRGADTNGVVEIDSQYGLILKDCIFTSNGLSGTRCTDDVFIGKVLKSRFVNYQYGMYATYGASALKCQVKDCLFDGADYGNDAAMYLSMFSDVLVEECEAVSNFIFIDLPNAGAVARVRNCVSDCADARFFKRHEQELGKFGFSEDHDGTVDDSRQRTSLADSEGDDDLASETTIVRGGGSNKSIEVTPSVDLATTWELPRFLVFELPIFATAASKTYTVYFRTELVANWTANPTAAELWIELEAWGGNTHRRIIKSTGTLNFTGSILWQALTVTVAPAQAGVAYLRCYYCKEQELGKSNVFYVDPIPVIA